MEECSSCGNKIDLNKGDYTIHEITNVRGNKVISSKFIYCLFCSPNSNDKGI